MTVVIYSKDNCSFCTLAISLVKSKGIEPEVKKIGEDVTIHKFKQLFPDAKTVPQILVNGELVPNGYAGLVKHFQK